MKTSIPKNNWGVHRTHCCSKHGCKYGDEDCPVVTGEVEQDYPCESCTMDKEDEEMNREAGYYTFKKIKLFVLTGATGERSGGELGVYADEEFARAKAPTAAWYGSAAKVHVEEALYDEQNLKYYRIQEVEPVDEKENLINSIKERIEEEFTPEELQFISANIDHFKVK